MSAWIYVSGSETRLKGAFNLQGESAENAEDMRTLTGGIDLERALKFQVEKRTIEVVLW